MPGKPKFTIDEMVAAVQRGKGIASVAAKHLGCDWQTVTNYRKRYPRVEETFRLEREKLGDLAEGKLVQAIANGEGWATCFFLKTQMKHRGYAERHEVTGKDGGALEVSDPFAQILRKLMELPQEGIWTNGHQNA